MKPLNRQFKLIAYADGLPRPHHFRLEETPQPEPGEGEFVVQVHYLGMDPFPRLRMSGPDGAVPPLPLGSVMMGRGVGQIVASRHPDFAEGTFVAGELGWQEFALSAGVGLQKIDPALGPVSTSLGVLGPPGLAAYFATLRQGKPQPGETVVISAAAGAVGSIAGQIAKLQVARVVGIADGPAKMHYLRQELGLDEVVDYKAVDDLAAAIQTACPKGVDVFLDLVGGETHDAVMAHINVAARIVLVGTLANYNQGGVDNGPRHLLQMILKRATMQGFLVGDYAAEFAAALSQLSHWLQSGQLIYKETIVEGFENVPQAFANIFQGDQVGKFLVKTRGF